MRRGPALSLSRNDFAASSSNTRTVPVGPPSPTFSDATNASQMNFGPRGPEKVITRADLKTSLRSYEELVNTCANYRTALVSMAKATAAFADSMQSCAGLKGTTYESGTRLQAASGLHYLIGNQWHVLSDTLDKKFEKPLRQQLDNYRQVVSDRSLAYERALREKSKIIRQTEQQNLAIGKKKQRNLQNFREALAVLQRQVDELDELKLTHYQEILEHEEEEWGVVQEKVSLVVRSTLDLFDRVTAKASDPILEPMLQAIPDPFDSYGPPKPEDEIFSILPPLAILNPSPSPSPLTPEVELSTTHATGSNAWNAGVVGTGFSSDAWNEREERDSGEGQMSPRSGELSPSRSITPTRTPSTSPPGTARRQSFPPSSSKPGVHHPRKSETRLRSVLSAIEEREAVNGAPSRETSEHTVRGAFIPDASTPAADYNTPWDDASTAIVSSLTEDKASMDHEAHPQLEQDKPPTVDHDAEEAIVAAVSS